MSIGHDRSLQFRERTQAFSHFAVESAMTCAMRLLRGAPCAFMASAERATKSAEVSWTIV